VKKQHDPLTRRNDGITELASQIEAEISGGSREALQQLLAKLAASDDDSEEAEGYRRDEFDEAPYPGRIVGPDDGRHRSRRKVASTRGTSGDRLARPGGRGGS
jgi:hypothetical protein